MAPPIDLRSHKIKIAYLNRVIAQTLADYKAVANDRGTVYYNLDFSLLCPLLFQRPSEGSNDFLEPVKEWMRHVMEMAGGKSDIKLIISAATLYEFYDQMNHLLESIKYNKPKILERYFNKRVDDDSGITTEEIRKNLLIFSEQGYNHQVIEPVSRLLSFFDEKIVFGIGDYFEKLTSQEVKAFEEMTETFLSQHLRQRLQDPNNKRDFDNSRFHFRMDAINNALSVILARRKGHTPLFVTPTPLNHEQCISKTGNVGRQDRVPLFFLNIESLSEKGYFGDAHNYLSDAFRVSASLEKELRQFDQVQSVPLYIQQKLEAFYKMYAAPLAAHSSADEDENIDGMREEISAVLSSKEKMSQALDRAVDDIRLSAIELDEYAQRIDTTYVESERTAQDPIVKKLREELLRD